MRQIVLDTETGTWSHRRVSHPAEIGCIGAGKPAEAHGQSFHRYINPDREVDLGAIESAWNHQRVFG